MRIAILRFSQVVAIVLLFRERKNCDDEVGQRNIKPVFLASIVTEISRIRGYANKDIYNCRGE